MNDWYPSQDPKRAAFLKNSVANMDKACGLLNVSTSTYAEPLAAAHAWLAAYAQRQEAQRVLDSAVLAFQKQAAATDKSVRAAAKQIKSIMSVPIEVLELFGGGDAATIRVAAPAPYRRAGHRGA